MRDGVVKGAVKYRVVKGDGMSGIERNAVM